MAKRVQWFGLDGDIPKKLTKAEVAEWLRRMSANVRDMRAALARNDADWFLEVAEDASGCGGELFNIGTATCEEASVGG